MALDTARRVGHAYCFPGEPPIFGSFATGRPGSDVGTQLVAFRRWFVGKLDELQPRHVWYLRPIRTQFDNTNRLERLFGFATIIRVETLDRGLSCESAEDATVIGFFTGRSRWGTEDMKASDRRAAKKDATMKMCERMGWPVDQDNDAADSLALLSYAEHKLAPKLAATRGLVLRAG